MIAVDIRSKKTVTCNYIFMTTPNKELLYNLHYKLQVEVQNSENWTNRVIIGLEHKKWHKLKSRPKERGIRENREW